MARADAEVDAAMARDMISAYRHNKGLGPLEVDPGLQGRGRRPRRGPWPRPTSRVRPMP